LTNISSAQKSTRSSLKKQVRNKAVKSSTKTRVAKADSQIAGGNKEAAKAAVKEASSALDKAAKRKILHANTVSRNKSRLARRLNKMAETTTEKAAKPAVKTAAKKTAKKKTEK
jgi:small subunit ribosomal protein S20